MTPNPHPACLVCRLLYAGQGQPLPVFEDLLKVVRRRYRCRCPRGKRHHASLEHPHFPDNCAGIAHVMAIDIEIKESMLG